MNEKTFCGFIVRRECWSFTFRGKLFLIVLVLGLLFFIKQFVHPFLAITEPVPSDVLVVEGWMPPNTLAQAAAEFRRGHYQWMILMRPIVDESDKYQSDAYEGDYKANLLIRYGVPKGRETNLFPIMAQKDRTYHSALAVKQWLIERGMKVKSLDVASLGPHARRSRLMYEKAFGGDVKIGIIALPDREYDAAHWWRSSEGVREVIGESIAYIYARFLFRPSTS
ncbi:MAG TPA: hypothetical protein VFC44_22120 [Candidatus Saccharimonadales bacterium]|nr:hypothetical protein [Candidatus Saccharimonadales bacterium]